MPGNAKQHGIQVRAHKARSDQVQAGCGRSTTNHAHRHLQGCAGARVLGGHRAGQAAPSETPWAALREQRLAFIGTPRTSTECTRSGTV